MQTHVTCPPAARSAAQRAHQIAAYLLSGAQDPQACVELARLARVVYAEAVVCSLEDLEQLAEKLAAIAESRVIDFRSAPELDAAVERLLVLADSVPLTAAPDEGSCADQSVDPNAGAE